MKPEWKKLLVLNLPYLLFVYLFAKCGQAYRLAAGVDASAKLLHLTNGISAAFANPLPSLHPFDLCVGVVGAVAVRLIVYSKGKNAKKYRKGEEYGSARWGTAKDIAPYIDPKFENNILLTQTERLTMTGRPKDPKTARNKNVLVIGGSGSGKTRFYVKPNLMQCFPTSDYPTSFVVTDPKGTLVLETGQMFQRAGYRVKILNTINFSKSMKYNPFVYIHSEKDVLKLVNTLIANTKGEGEKSAEDFWVKSERLFYTALIGYIWYEAPAEEMNFTTLLEMINASEAREDDPDFQSPVDLMFERLEQKDPDHFAVRQYKKFLLSAGKTRSSILISCGARLAPFDIREVRELMEDDEMELDTIGDEKTALFLIMSDTDTTFNFILAMGAVTRITSMGTLVVFGFLKGFQPIAGFSYGAKKFDRLREAIKTSIIWSTSFCLVVGLVMAVFSMQIISQFTKGDTQMILVGQKSLFANGITFILFGFYTVYSSLFLALGKGAAGFFLGACRQGVCFVPVILLLPMVWGMNGILYAQPIADVISVVITVFMALHLHRELSMAEKQVMSNSEM